jgi:hypothetical protein
MRNWITFSLMLFITQSFGQVKNDSLLTVETTRYYNSFFVEIGSFDWYAVGYECRIHEFKKLPFGVYSNVDFSYDRLRLIHTGFGLGLTYGKKHQVDFELTGILEWRLDIPLSSLGSELEAKYDGRDFALPIETVSSIGVGYRVQLLKNRLMLRAKPLYLFKYDFVGKGFTYSRFWFSVGIGYQFGKR